MVVELHGLRKGADRWEFVETLATMAPAVFAAKARDRKASWSLFDTNKQRRTMIAMESHGRKDPTPGELEIMLMQQALRLAFLESTPTPHEPDLSNWRKPGIRRVVKGPAPCRQFGAR